MGGELVNSSASLFSFEKTFNDVLPHLMAVGLSYEDFWYGEADKAKYVIEAEKIKRKNKDYDLWLMGRYVYDALLSVSPVLHAFAKEGTKPMEYLKEPYPRTEEDLKQIREREIREQAEAFRAFVNAKNEERRINNG